MKELLREAILRKTCKTVRKITEKEFCFETDTVVYETERAITECVLYMFLIKIFGVEEKYKIAFSIQVKNYLIELTTKEILILKKTKSGKNRYSFNKKYYESIKDKK